MTGIWKQRLQNHNNETNLNMVRSLMKTLFGLKMRFLKQLKTFWWRKISISTNHMVMHVLVKIKIRNDLKI